jgi:subtilisin family serine protease
MTGDCDRDRRARFERGRFWPAALVAVCVAVAGAGAAFAQQIAPITNIPNIGRPTIGPIAPTTIPNTGGGGVTTAPRPTGVGITGGGVTGGAPAGVGVTGGGGGPIANTPSLTPTTPTVTPRIPTTTTTALPTSTPTGINSTPSAGPNTMPQTGVNPNINIDPRTPGGGAGRGGGGGGGSEYSFGSNPNCASSYKSFEGFGGRACTTRSRRAVAQSKGGDQPAQTKNAAKATKKGSAKGPVTPAVIDPPDAVAREIIIEVDGTVTEAQAIALADRHRLTRVESQNFPLIGATMFRWRIPDGRSIEAVTRQLLATGSIRAVTRNYRFALQQAETARDDPGQYAIGKLHLIAAHAVTKGDDVRIAVIDSGIDVAHPELAGAIAGTYDALRSTEGAHTHGTGIAGAIVAKSRLLGSAPQAKLLAIRAFGATSGGAESTSFVLLKSLNYAVEQGAQIINMSFAGPKDPLLERGLAAAAKRGVILIAAAGNAGPKSPPLYPAADRNVIAVTATDTNDRLFEASNRGNYMAVAAPGVDLLLPAPEEKYQVASGTSFAAAYVSGVAALIVERNPGVSPDVVRRILTDTARDLGPKGKDEQFGFGLANALAVVQAARPMTAGAGTRAIELPRATR